MRTLVSCFPCLLCIHQIEQVMSTVFLSFHTHNFESSGECWFSSLPVYSRSVFCRIRFRFALALTAFCLSIKVHFLQSYEDNKIVYRDFFFNKAELGIDNLLNLGRHMFITLHVN